MHITKKVLTILLIMSFVLSFAACGEDGGMSVLDVVKDLELSKEESVEQSEEDPAPKEGQTAMPKILQSYNSDQTHVVLAGTCEEGATITVSHVGSQPVTATAGGTLYAIEVEVGTKAEVQLQITATAPGKTESDAKSIIVGYAPSQDGNLVYPTVLADGVNLYLKETIGTVSEESVRTDTAAKNLTKEVNSYISSLASYGDTELIYVLIPNKASMDKDALPEGTPVSENVTVYDQALQALNSTKATVIDMRDVFANADTSKYPLYYRTHSTMSEYAAYLTYKTVMDYVAKTYPDAAPRAEDEFDVKTIENALGGDLAYHFGLDINNFVETVYDFVPKFDTAIGDSVPEEWEEKSHLINAIKQYIAENDYRYYNSYFVKKLLGVDASVTRADESFGFFTGRDTLPTALIYRDEYSTPMVDMLAERFNNSLFETANQLNVNVTKASAYAAEGKENVDYVIVFASEDSLADLMING